MFGLSFLYPAFLLGAAAVAVPIVLHLRRRPDAPAVAFTAVRFIRRQPPERTRRRSLKELVLLALRVTALAALALAFARPFVARALSGAGDLTVILLDDSFSMAAGSRMARARTEVDHALDALKPGGRAALVIFDSAPRVVVSPGTDLAAIRSAAAAAAGFSGTRYRPAFERAIALFQGGGGRIVFVSDLHRAGWVAGDHVELPAEVKLVVRPVSEAPGNLAVTEAGVANGRISATVRNFSPETRATVAALRIDGRALATVPVQVGAGASQAFTFASAAPPRQGFASVEVRDAGGAPADDTYFWLFDPPPRLPVLAVVANEAARKHPPGGEPGVLRESLYVERALDLGDDSPFRITPISADQVTRAHLGDYAAVILLGSSGADRQFAARLREFVSNGGGVLAAAGEEFDGHSAEWTLASIAPARVADSIDSRSANAAAFWTLQPNDARHPVFRVFEAGRRGDVGRARFFRALRLEPDPAAHVLARFDNGAPALIERKVGSGAVLLFASDLAGNWNDFPVRATFVPFVHETLRYLTVGRAGGRVLHVGDRVPETAVPMAGPAIVAGAGGRNGAPGTIAAPGVYEVRDARGDRRRVAVNVDPAESNPAGLTEAEFRKPIVEGGRAIQASAQTSNDRHAVEQAQSLWRIVLLLVLVTLVAETALASRTV